MKISNKVVLALFATLCIFAVIIGILVIRKKLNERKYSDYITDQDFVTEQAVEDKDLWAEQAIEDFVNFTQNAVDIYPVYEYDMDNKYSLSSDNQWEIGAATSALQHWNCEEVIKDEHKDSCFIVVFRNSSGTYSAVVNDVYTEVGLVEGSVLD